MKSGDVQQGHLSEISDKWDLKNFDKNPTKMHAPKGNNSFREINPQIAVSYCVSKGLLGSPVEATAHSFVQMVTLKQRNL
jgi:hypothetical protein